MKNLEYQLGNIRIDDPTFVVSDEFTKDYLTLLTFANPHHFVVEGMPQRAILHVGNSSGHDHLVDQFKLIESTIVGGGFFYQTSSGVLVIEGGSGSFGSIPQYAAEQFIGLLKNYLGDQNHDIKGIKVNTGNSASNNFWKL